MTPLIRFLTRHLPLRIVLPALVLIYTLTLLAVLLLLGQEQALIYLDVGRH